MDISTMIKILTHLGKHKTYKDVIDTLLSGKNLTEKQRSKIQKILDMYIKPQPQSTDTPANPTSPDAIDSIDSIDGISNKPDNVPTSVVLDMLPQLIPGVPNSVTLGVGAAGMKSAANVARTNGELYAQHRLARAEQQAAPATAALSVPKAQRMQHFDSPEQRWARFYAPYVMGKGKRDAANWRIFWNGWAGLGDIGGDMLSSLVNLDQSNANRQIIADSVKAGDKLSGQSADALAHSTYGAFSGNKQLSGAQ